MPKHTLMSALGAAFCVLLLTGTAWAQGDPGSTGPTPAVLPPTGVPVDAGVSLLLVAGAAYGLKRLRKHQIQK